MAKTDIFRLYHDAYQLGTGHGGGVSWPREDDDARSTVTLALYHARAGLAPLTRAELLAEVARLGGEAIEGPLSFADGEVSGATGVLDALEKWIGSGSARGEWALAAWIADERAKLGGSR
jgi:hypothetical protein